jgi:hypothetical protein
MNDMFRKVIVFAALGLLAAAIVFGAVSYAQQPQAGSAQAAAQPITSQGQYGPGQGQGISWGTGAGQGANGQSAATGAQLDSSAVAADTSASLDLSAAAAQPHSGALLPAPADLSQAEAEALLFMREEEKLARDVYAALYQTWGLPVFENIQASEQMHMDSVKTLLDVYGLADPASAQAGVFTNPDLQALYDQLVAQGSQSLAEALKVGGAIEEIDILDLQQRIAATDNADILQVFNNLVAGSENHLRAFVNNYERQTGEAYQPQYLSWDAYQAIVSAASGNGQANRGGGNGKGNGNGGGGGRP